MIGPSKNTQYRVHLYMSKIGLYILTTMREMLHNTNSIFYYRPHDMSMQKRLQAMSSLAI